jgi:hypothetical protein
MLILKKALLGTVFLEGGLQVYALVGRLYSAINA